MTETLFQHDPYLRECTATVLESISDGIVLDRTVFYPTGGGQPGDRGELRFDGQSTPIETTRYRRDDGAIVHVPGEGAPLPEVASASPCSIQRSSSPRACLQGFLREGQSQRSVGPPRSTETWYGVAPEPWQRPQSSCSARPTSPQTGLDANVRAAANDRWSGARSRTRGTDHPCAPVASTMTSEDRSGG